MRWIALLLALTALAGCTAPDDGTLPEGSLPTDPNADTSEPANGFAPQTGQGEDVDGDLALVATLRQCDAGFCIDAVATNEGSEPAYVSNICVTPHGERLEENGDVVQHREPYAVCQAWGVREWAANEQIPFELEWDGTLWNDEAQKYEPAPDGTAYEWFATFTAYRDQDGGAPVQLEVGIPVIIGET